MRSDRDDQANLKKLKFIRTEMGRGWRVLREPNMAKLYLVSSVAVLRIVYTSVSVKVSERQRHYCIDSAGERGQSVVTCQGESGESKPLEVSKPWKTSLGIKVLNKLWKNLKEQSSEKFHQRSQPEAPKELWCLEDSATLKTLWITLQNHWRLR